MCAVAINFLCGGLPCLIFAYSFPADLGGILCDFACLHFEQNSYMNLWVYTQSNFKSWIDVSYSMFSSATLEPWYKEPRYIKQGIFYNMILLVPALYIILLFTLI